MKKKSIALMAIAVLMVASIATAYTLAFFTDKDSKENVFTVGSVDITLTEPNWAGGTEKNPAMKADPGVAVTKDPVVTNSGKNSAYVRMDVVVSDADAFTKPDGTPYSIFTASNAWTPVGNPVKENGTWTYTYTYNGDDNKDGKLMVGNTTAPLFQNVTLPASFTNAQVAALSDDGFSVTVKASAIQVDGFEADATKSLTAAQVAFNALSDQLSAKKG